MSAGFGIPAMGLVSAIGTGKADTSDALYAGTRKGFHADETMITGRRVFVGAVGSSLPATPSALRDLDCRNNRMMLAALEQIAPEIDAAKRRFGPARIAVILGTSTAGIAEGEVAFAANLRTGVWPEDFAYRQQENGALAIYAARAFGLTGLAYTVTTACASSAKVFASARRLMRAGLCDAAIIGGADTLCRLTLNGFASLEALSADLCNPFSANRDGITIGEGAAAFLLTREDAPVMLLGAGETSDAYHISAPDPAGVGATTAMRAALADAGRAPRDIAYINLHGTATPLNDAMEGKAVHALFGDGVPCGSTKGMTGHTLGASGGIEAAFLWLTLHPDFRTGCLPSHVWDGVAAPDIPPLALVDSRARLPDANRLAMQSNSFAFGGSSVSLVLGTRA